VVGRFAPRADIRRTQSGCSFGLPLPAPRTEHAAASNDQARQARANNGTKALAVYAGVRYQFDRFAAENLPVPFTIEVHVVVLVDDHSRAGRTCVGICADLCLDAAANSSRIMPHCPICKFEVKPLERTGDAEGFDCEEHGQFHVAGTVFRVARTRKAKPEQWEAALRKAQMRAGRGNRPIITTFDF
jgi:hypothetical protein